ncbi:Mitochondrial intermembrane space import and assembly protein 40 [Psilocybe cubensis]|uniref:Mitochondrial intermembrane space import and assembly protein 40 n=2 Tax=Psilocybe cubensis TaxID=181762 RepID=A0A8H7Y838_PSICU|nr:Mitochondrial intermembrane space import and assembly protein 40 [Psilocybe cubensis]KAH9485455.1 Mitochondrial intermembrane space import and assembly protein 40 [Psilocybe cubensis]
MFSRFARLPLRRCLHTSQRPATAPVSLGKAARSVLCASAVATAYLAWHMSREANELALDSPLTSRSTEKHPASNATRPVHAPLVPAPSASSSDSDAFVPDEPSDTADTTLTPSDPQGEIPASDGDVPPTGGQPAASGAFNPETGEINWDCPCLGGMAHGPCGPEFREAFSCFVFSEAEPKGINCVEKFQNMQNCFRAHPEVYADEIMDDDDEPADVDSRDHSDVSKNQEESPSELATTSKPHIDATPAASVTTDSS